MQKLYAGARALAFLVAIVGAFVTIPMVALILVVLGGVSAVGNKPEDNIRVYLVATVFTVAAKGLEAVPAAGTYLAAIFGGVGLAALGAAAVAATLAILRMTME